MSPNRSLLVLSSGSPRRKELLAQLGHTFTTYSPHIDESVLPDESPTDYVYRLAVSKAQAGLAQYPEAVVVGSDTSVVIGSDILGKPSCFSEFRDMMLSLSGNVHQVLTSIAVLSQQKTLAQVVVTEVTFYPLSEDDILNYWKTGEPQDKAGGYGIQGKGGVFVESMTGNYSAVVGLPLAQTARMLAAFNMGLWHES